MTRRYGSLPKFIADIPITMNELVMYQDMPIKLSNDTRVYYEERLYPFHPIISKAIDDFKNDYSIDEFNKRYIYLTVKNLFQLKGTPFNTEGYHADGFLSDDIIYVWSDKDQTIVNTSNFNLTPDQNISLSEMRVQAKPENDIQFPNNSLIRMDQFVIHKVAEVKEAGVRCFAKIVFSDRIYNLLGNSHNYMLNYEWVMIPRKNSNGRHVPAKGD